MVSVFGIASMLMVSGGMVCLGDVQVNDFESDQIGVFPGGSWVDIEQRVVSNPTPAPTMLVIETTGVDGNHTLAAQSVQAEGTSGMFVEIEDAPSHRFEIDLRVDSPTQTNSWAMAVGLIQDVGRGDVNLNTQAVVYTWFDRRMYLYVTQGQDIPGTVNLRLPNFQYEIGTWYRVVIDADGRNGVITATVLDGGTGAELTSRTHTATQWVIDRGRFDAYAVFDGEPNSAPGGLQATIDNVMYEPVFNCPVDFTGDGALDFFDVSGFLTAYLAADPRADFSGDGSFNFFDVSLFLAFYAAGCP